MQNIQQFNEELVKNNEDITITEYITKVNDLFYKIEIDFMQDFMNLVGNNECCIHHDMLVKYGVLTSIAVVKRLLDNNILDETIDDKSLYNVVHRDDKSHKIDYILHPKLFKIILIRSKNTTKYAKYNLIII